ncbi:MAG: PP2C family protein-serine/threonine phosphatase [Acidobacteria bacterium]|nr:PP2C family protein-serine/threonine phosphatase [Acidobacteriota bacterium]
MRSASAVRGLLAWALGAAVIGALIGVAVQILITTLDEERSFDWWFVRMSVLMALGITITTFIGSRYALPQFAYLPPLIRQGVILLTVVGGSIAVSMLSILDRPWIVLARPLDFCALVGANTVLALLIGGALVAWDRLKLSLESAYEELRAKEAIEREMTLAREVQQELLPLRAPRLHGYDVAFLCRPAAMVGGDTFDFIELPESRLGVTVGDVVGKGVPAALLMASVQALARAMAPRERSPARINHILSESLGQGGRPGRLVTFAYVVLDPLSGELAYSLAGHHPPLVVGSAGVRSLEACGLPLGVNVGIPYECGKDALAPGETLVIFTDGLVEAPSARDGSIEFGTERVREILAGNYRRGARALLDALVDAYLAHVSDQPASDDMTIVVIERFREREGGRHE